MPVHWFESTTSRRCVAVTGCGNVNERMIRFGATGLGATAGKASPGLVYTVVNPALVEQSAVFELHAWIWNDRNALNRLWPGPIMALTWTRLIVCAPPPSATVTCWPPAGVVSTSSHWVFSVSSIRLAGSSSCRRCST